MRLALLWLTCLGLGGPLLAEVKLPNGEYIERHQDLVVKVLGGTLSLSRTWSNGRWYLNPAWAALRFIRDPLDDSVAAIDRAGSLYLRQGARSVFDGIPPCGTGFTLPSRTLEPSLLGNAIKSSAAPPSRECFRAVRDVTRVVGVSGRFRRYATDSGRTVPGLD